MKLSIAGLASFLIVALTNGPARAWGHAGSWGGGGGGWSRGGGFTSHSNECGEAAPHTLGEGEPSTLTRGAAARSIDMGRVPSTPTCTAEAPLTPMAEVRRTITCTVAPPPGLTLRSCAHQPIRRLYLWPLHGYGEYGAAAIIRLTTAHPIPRIIHPLS
jgi:hypothetical protein